jgi:hypothetical protein
MVVAMTVSAVVGIVAGMALLRRARVRGEASQGPSPWPAGQPVAKARTSDNREVAAGPPGPDAPGQTGPVAHAALRALYAVGGAAPGWLSCVVNEAAASTHTCR